MKRLLPILLLLACAEDRPRPAYATFQAEPLPHGAQPNILLVTLCSVRPDHLGPWGHAGTSPNLDKVASSGTVFEHAWSNATFTLPAHAALLTGRLPARIGVMEASDHLGTTPTTLGEVLQLYGYRTLAWSTVSSAASFRKGEGLERGFQVFEEGPAGGAQERFFGAMPTDGSPWFAVVHFKSAHPPYGGPSAGEPPAIGQWIASREKPGRPQGSPDPDVVLGKAVNADPTVRDALYARYDRALTRVDDDVGRLLGHLEARGQLANTAIIVTGDHGESLGEGGFVGHQQLTEPVARIPMLIDLPDGMGEIPRAAADVSLVDLMPTILELAGATPPAGMDGVSLLPLMRGETTTTHLQVNQALTRSATPTGQPQRYSGAEALIAWPYWLLHTPGSTTGRLFRYDGEWKNVTDTEPDKLAAMIDARRTQAADGTWPAEAKPISQAVRDEIRKSGYW